MEVIPKYKIGDNVKIVNYGHWVAFSKTDYPNWDLLSRQLQQEEFAAIWGLKIEDIEKEELVLNPNAKPENIIAEDEFFYWVDINPGKIGTKDIVKDVNLMELTRNVAITLLKQDPDLMMDSNRNLKEFLLTRKDKEVWSRIS